MHQFSLLWFRNTGFYYLIILEGLHGVFSVLLWIVFVTLVVITL